jgi:tetratricopeptide (TPR) repeat protein
MTKKAFWIKFTLLAVAGSLLYANTLRGEFHLDDIPFIVKNPTIRDITNLALIGKSILGEHARHVVFFSLALNYHLNKLDVFGYHIFNTIIHILTALGIWQFTRMLLSTPRFKAETPRDNRENIAFCAALLFLCHPANTQAIAYITQRFASMATMFYVGALAFYIKARLTPAISRAWPFYVLAAAAALGGMFSKEIVITLPLMLLIIDRTCLCPPAAAATAKSNPAPANKTPLILILAALLGLALIIPCLFHFEVATIFKASMPSSSHEGDILTFRTFFLSQWRVMAVILRLLVLPVHQNLDYDFPMSTGLFTPITTFTSLLLLIGLAAGAWAAAKRRFIITLGILWFFITYLPEFYPRVHVIFEHKFYLTTIGIFIALSYALWQTPRLKDHARWIMIALCIILGIATVRRNAVWRTEQTLWEDIIRNSPDKYRANLNLGNVYQLQGEYDRSLPYYNKAITVMPYGYKAYNSRGVVYYMKGNADAAMADFNMAIRANPAYDDPYNNRGNLYRQRGEYQKAIDDYNRSIRISQFAPVAYKNRGDAYAKLNNVDNAVADYQSALKLDPKFRDAYNSLGNFLKDQKRFDDALGVFTAAIRNDPANRADYFVGRGNVYSGMNEPSRALEEFRQALQLRPSMTEPLFNTGVTYMSLGQLERSDEFYSLALQSNPKLAAAYNNRGEIRRRLGRRKDAIEDFLNADRLAPRMTMIRGNLIRAYLEDGQTANAVTAYNDTIRQGVPLDPSFRKLVN